MNIQEQIDRRPKNRGPTCRYLATNRNSIFKDIPFEQFIPLAFHTTVPQLQAANLDQLVNLVCQKYKSDLYIDWQRYCKDLGSEEQRVIATLEGAFHFAAESISSLEYRKLWKSSCCLLLRDLENLKTTAGETTGEISDRKRKRGDDENCSNASNRCYDAKKPKTSRDMSIVDVSARAMHAPETDNLHRQPISTIPLSYYQETFYKIVLAKITKVPAFKDILGRRLYEDVIKSRSISLGDPVVQLHMPATPDEDCVLQVSISISTGKIILDGKNGSFELIDAIGHYLFRAMMKTKLSGRDTGLRGTIGLDGHDLFLAIDFTTGKHMMSLEAQST
ncbi:hypothetical protein TSTA_012410, partial [Talaromyces stipitatus ATCC 10500]